MLDLEHLDVYTMGDKALQSEVLGLFHQQLLSARDTIPAMAPPERKKLAHCLVGSALAVGAMTLADQANALAANPEAEEAVRKMLCEIDAVTLFLDNMRGKQPPADG